MSVKNRMLSWLLGYLSPTKRGEAGAYKPFTTAFDREVLANDLDSVLGLLSENDSNALEHAWQVFEAGFQGWRTQSHIYALNRSVEVLSTVSDAKLSDSVISILIDQSGSMRGQRMLLAAAAADIIQDFSSQFGCAVEVLGFTTTSWKGGNSRRLWLAAGRPENPGRLCDLLHIIYRSATMKATGTMSWRLRPMLRADLPKENIDGEALEWAVSRLQNLHHKNQFVVLLSDGGPSDDSTHAENGVNYLRQHLADVLVRLEQEANVRFAAVGIGADVSRYYGDGIVLRTPEDLGKPLLDKITSMLLTLAA